MQIMCYLAQQTNQKLCGCKGDELYMLEFEKITEFPRGTLYDILQDAYSFDRSSSLGLLL